MRRQRGNPCAMCSTNSREMHESEDLIADLTVDFIMYTRPYILSLSPSTSSSLSHLDFLTLSPTLHLSSTFPLPFFLPNHTLSGFFICFIFVSKITIAPNQVCSRIALYHVGVSAELKTLLKTLRTPLTSFIVLQPFWSHIHSYIPLLPLPCVSRLYDLYIFPSE